MLYLDKLSILSKKAEPENRLFFKNIKPGKANELDKTFHKINDEVFSHTDCLKCANCCKALGPRLSERDIRQLSKTLNIKASVFEQQYLRIDEDGDYVFKTMPCPFLGSDNYCSVYKNRPKACSDYPHTHQPEILRKSKVTIKNSYTCPAVYEILEEVKKIWK
jgi:Fe-S-cluster containining protein